MRKRLSRNDIVKSVSQLFTRNFGNVIGRLELHGIENVPSTPCLLVANHVSGIDPHSVSIFKSARKVVAVARNTLFEMKLVGEYLRMLEVIPIKRGEGGDISAFKSIINAIKSGQSVLIFPEGTRSRNGELQSGKAGVGLIALKTGVPILPIRTYGFESTIPNKLDVSGRLIMVAGKPIDIKDIDPGKGHPERMQAIVDEIMRAIGEIEKPKYFEV